MSRTLAMISLHPQYWDMYLDGSKIWELRKVSHSPMGVDGLVIYATAPVSRIVGEVSLVRCQTGYVDDIWCIVKDGCGITRAQYDRYYQGLDLAMVYRLGDVYEYTPPIATSFAPQGYRYLIPWEHEYILSRTERRLVHAAR